jgi:glycosyltransferase involved in cell wall biosynthesis
LLDQADIKRISAIIPAKNEASTISQVVGDTKKYADEVLVIDDSSTDTTGEVAKRAGAAVVQNQGEGYIDAIKTGFRKAQGDIVVTLDGDGEHNPEEIPSLIHPILDGGADLVLGKRKDIARPSERVISFVTKRKTGIADSGTGFRAMKKNLALALSLEGRCICGISVLEPYYLGATITEIPITLNDIQKKRKIAWDHIPQLLYVLKWLIKREKKRK